jgi:multiple sugar transport system substrate-binding protein
VRKLRRALAVTAFLSITSLAAGCAVLGGSSGSTRDTLEFWMYQPADAKAAQTYDQLRAEFEKANNVTVKLVQIPKDDYNTKLSTALSGGGGPDAGYLDQPLVARYALDGTIAALPAGTIDESAFYAGALNTNRVGGKLYGLPLDHTTIALFYNKKLIPTPPKTWTELKDMSAAVHQANPGIAGIVVPKGDGYGAWMWPGFVASAGGTLLDESNKKVLLDSKPAVDALSLWVDLLPSSPRKITDSAKAFETGHAAMTITGPWDVTAIKDQFPDLSFGVAPLPYRDKPASNIGGENLVVFKHTAKADLAWKWLTLLTSKEHNAAVAQGLGGFATNIAAADAAKSAAQDPSYSVFLEQLAVAQARPTVPQWIQINDEIIAPALDRALAGKQTPQQALSQAAGNARSLLSWPQT